MRKTDYHLTKPLYYLWLICLLWPWSLVQAAVEGGVEYRVSWQTSDQRYHVYLRPTTTPEPDISLSAQVTLRVPHASGKDQFQVADISARPNTFWVLASAISAPIENPNYDYLSFNYVVSSSNVLATFDFKAGIEREIFSFKNTGRCLGSVVLLDNNKDPFRQNADYGFNSVGIDPNNFFSSLGWGTETDNDYKGNYGEEAICDGSFENTPPTAQADSVTVLMNKSIAISVLSNDTDADYDELNVTSFTQSNHGHVTQQNNRLIYTPDTDFSGKDFFTYTIKDQQGATASASVEIIVAKTASECHSEPTNPQANHLYYRLSWSENDQRYHVYMYPGSLPQRNMTLSSQVTLKVPHGLDKDSFTVTNLKSSFIGALWTDDSRANAPLEDPSADYISFTLHSLDPTAFKWKAEQEIEVFSFDNLGSCLGPVSLLENNDAFAKLPNSVNTNPGNQFTNIGWPHEGDNNYAGNYGCPAICIDPTKDKDGDGLADGMELELGTDPANNDTDRDGIIDGEEIKSGSSPLKADSIKLQVKALLQGAYNDTDKLMHDDLRSKQLLPHIQPYAAAPTFYQGQEQITDYLLATSGQDAPVDWVLIELRDARDMTVIKYRFAALLQRDGDVIAVDGKTDLLLTNIAVGPYYVVLKHRNHLGVMSAQAINLNAASTLIDFTQASTATYGQEARLIVGNTALLWAGNANDDDKVIVSGPMNDISEILTTILVNSDNIGISTNYRLTGYYKTDINLDGLTIFAGAANDIDVLLGNILLYPLNGSLSANYIIKQQVP